MKTFVTAKTIGGEVRQGWLEKYTIVGESGKRYLCEGIPKEVINPPEAQPEDSADCEHKTRLFPGSNICDGCGCVIVKEGG